MQKQKERNLIEIGVKDGISVKFDNEGYIIQMPDRFDLYYGLVGKNKPGDVINKVNPLDDTQRVKDIVIRVPLEKLEPKTINYLNTVINNARKTNLEIKDEILLQDIYLIPWKVSNYEKKGIPKNSNIDCEVIAVGKYFVSVIEVNDAAEKPIVRSIPTHKILKFEEGDYKSEYDRLDRVKQRLGISDTDYNLNELKDGVNRHMTFDDKGKCLRVSKDKPEEITQEPTLKPLKIKSNGLALTN